MQISTILMLILARFYAGVPFVVISGYRDENHPLTKKSPTSSHAKGLAVDIAVNDATKHIIEKALRKAGFTRIGINEAGNTIHADNDTNKTQNVTWFYDDKAIRYGTTALYYV